MRRLLVAMIPLLLTGCGYMRDRWADAKDVFTLGVGPGIGAVARVGPLQTGLGATADMVALANGEWAIGGLGICGVMDTSPVMACAAVIGTSSDGAGEARRKNFDVLHAIVPIHTDHWPSAPYYTQIEISGGALLSVHVGFNPGELLDFVLGWVGIDIYRDDQHHRRRRRREPARALEPLAADQR